MASYTNISDFSYKQGLDLTKNNQSFTYLYGLSDFWQYLFQDTATANLLLETTSTQASDIYSKFLHLCSGISIADIAASANSQLRLEIINSSNTLPTDIAVVSGVWNNNFTTLTISDTSDIVVGDTIVVSGIEDLIIYDIGNGINTNPIGGGGTTVVEGGYLWNGTFIVTEVLLGNRVVYYQPVDPGTYTTGGKVSVTSIGVETYQLPEKVVSSRLLSNKPFLPTIVLEDKVDYFLDEVTSRISFAKPLNSYGFPSRINSSGETEYSVWFVDVRYDEPLIYEHFSRLLGRTSPKVPSEDYRNFLYGLFYIYTSGPTLSVIQKGINLSLGVPLARDVEVVLEIRPYLDTNQLIVITDLNSYIIPYGLAPTVVVDQVLQIGDELAKWVEILDYQSANEWWKINPIEIPEELMPLPPVGFSRIVTGVTTYYPGQGMGDGINTSAINDGSDTYGSYTIDDYGSWVMNNYLKYNTFLVKINVSANIFNKIQKFEDIRTLILDLKPRHTYPIYLYYDSTVLGLIPNMVTASIGDVESQNSIQISGVISSTVVSDVGSGLMISSVTGATSIGDTIVLSDILLSGVTSSSSVGDVDSGHNLAGNEITAVAGTVSVEVEAAIFGNTISGEVTDVYSFALGLTGVSGTTSVASIEGGILLTAVQAAFYTGDVLASSPVTLSPLVSTISAGDIDVFIDIETAGLLNYISNGEIKSSVSISGVSSTASISGISTGQLLSVPMGSLNSTVYFGTLNKVFDGSWVFDGSVYFNNTGTTTILSISVTLSSVTGNTSVGTVTPGIT